MNNRAKGSLMMIVSSVAFSFMQIMIGMTSGTIPVFEQMIFRNAVTAIIAYMALRKKGVRQIWGKRENAPMLFARSLFGFLAMFFLFYATGKGNQGEVAILSKLSPLQVLNSPRSILYCIKKTSHGIALPCEVPLNLYILSS